MNYAKTVIYMADDDPDDRYFMRQSLQTIYPEITVVEAEDGCELLALLTAGSQAPVPQLVHLILLDINMPRMNGLEALMAIKANPLLQHIPTVIVSTAAEPSTMDNAYLNGASDYLKKPISCVQMDQIARTFRNYLSGEASC